MAEILSELESSNHREFLQEILVSKSNELTYKLDHACQEKIKSQYELLSRVSDHSNL
jgi:hypothetical protein